MAKEFYRISGKKIELPAQTPSSDGKWIFEKRPGGYFIAMNREQGKRIRLLAVESGGKFSFSAGSEKSYGEIIKQSFSSGSESGGGLSDADFTAQFPGKVRKVLVSAGQAVEAGQPLLLLEAMKMEFSIKAPTPGTVKKVNVTEGMQLTPGLVMIDFTETKKAKGSK